MTRGGTVVASHFAEPEGPREPEARGRTRRIVTLALAIVVLLAGGGFLVAPTVSAVVAQEGVEHELEELRREVEVKDGVSEDGAEASEGAGEGFLPKGGDATYAALEAYNERIRSGEGDSINDPFATEGGGISELGVPDGLIGTIEIPRMSVILPLYLGSTTDNLSRGATVVAGTSMPIGGESTNCAIAAHRGGIWSGFQMFRDIELLQPGDTLTITTPWDELTYEVSEIRVVLPSEVDSVRVQEGRDMVTLLTCHPYLVSSHRYLVYCDRVETDEAQESPGIVERAATAFFPAPSGESPSLTLELGLKVAGLAILLVVVLLLAVDLVRTVARRR